MITQKNFGKTKDGKDVTCYSISGDNGFKADVINYGAILVNLFVPNKDGEITDVALGYDKLDDYFENSCFFGATTGPIANRTKDAKFTLNGVEYQLDVNDGANNLHSHFTQGLHQKYYDTTVLEEENGVKFVTELSDGELGMPGNRVIAVTYSVKGTEIIIQYDVVSDKDTIINVTNHSYFNLSGHDSGSIHDHKLQINASAYTEILPGAIPTGNSVPVVGNEFDFTSLKRIGDEVDNDMEQLTMVGGYDHNFVLDNYDKTVRKVACLVDEKAKRTMEVYTDLPGIQFYAGNAIASHTGKNNASYTKRCGLALETQYFPNSANDPNFEKPVLKASENFTTITSYKFI